MNIIAQIKTMDLTKFIYIIDINDQRWRKRKIQRLSISLICDEGKGKVCLNISNQEWRKIIVQRLGISRISGIMDEGNELYKVYVYHEYQWPGIKEN